MAKHFKFDVAIVGSGIAGLSVALRLADKGFSVCIITKKDSAESISAGSPTNSVWTKVTPVQPIRTA